MKTLNSPQAGCRSLWNQRSEICVCKFRLTSGYNLWLTATKIMWLRKSPLGHCRYNRFRLMFQSNWNSLKAFSLFYHCTLDRQPVHRRLWKPTFQNNCCRFYIDIRISACIISIKALGFFPVVRNKCPKTSIEQKDMIPRHLIHQLSPLMYCAIVNRYHLFSGLFMLNLK